jgi:sensor histidine kinase YesM
VRVSDAAALGHISMPPMLLLPLVENAVKHGVEPKPGVVSVDVDISATHDTLTIVVTDDGAGFAHDAGSGIGIANVRDRLAALFKEAASVIVEPRESGGVKATLSIPIRHE